MLVNTLPDWNGFMSSIIEQKNSYSPSKVAKEWRYIPFPYIKFFIAGGVYIFLNSIFENLFMNNPSARK